MLYAVSFIQDFPFFHRMLVISIKILITTVKPEKNRPLKICKTDFFNKTTAKCWSTVGQKTPSGAF